MRRSGRSAIQVTDKPAAANIYSKGNHMTVNTAKLNTGDQNLQLKNDLLIIEGLVVVVPFLVLFYLFHRNHYVLAFSQLLIIALMLSLVLAGLMIVRQIFDRFIALAGAINKAGMKNDAPRTAGKDSADFHKITQSFEGLMNRFEETTRELEKRVFELFSIKELAELAARCIDIDGLLQALLEKAMVVSQSSAGSVTRVDPTDHRLRVIAVQGNPLLEARTPKISEALLARFRSHRKPLLFQEAGGDPKAADSAGKPASRMILPLFAKNRLIALVDLAHKNSGKPFDANDTEVLAVMVQEIEFALENAMLHADLRMHLDEIERRSESLKEVNRRLVQEIKDRKAATKALNRAKTRLMKLKQIEALGTLAGGIAHNFNNLLMGIQGNVSIALLGIDTDSAVVQNLENIGDLVKKGSTLTRQLLGYACKGDYERCHIDLNGLIKALTETFCDDRKAIVLHRHLADHLPKVMADAQQIEQALLCLMTNAADAMPAGGDLFVKTAAITNEDTGPLTGLPEPGHYVRLTVQDSGPGMDPNTAERIFDPFFTTKGIACSTGLGLASAYGIIKGHHGHIDVDSCVGRGTTFDIYLPVSAGHTLQ